MVDINPNTNKTIILQVMKIPLTPLQVDQLIATLDMDGDGDIDFG